MTPADKEALFQALTQDSPLIVFGRVLKRWTITGNTNGRDWLMRQALISGASGVAQKIYLSDKESSCPAKGELAMIPCFIGNNGHPREAREQGTEF